MLTLGFTNVYYTLWNVTEPTPVYEGEHINGKFIGSISMVINYTYKQNLSMNYDEAVEKITKLAAKRGNNKWDEDLSLCGSKSWCKTLSKRMASEYPEVFSFGQLQGKFISEATDVWQLNRAMEQEYNPRSRVYARRRLLELGELVHYKWTEKRRRGVLNADGSFKEENGQYVYEEYEVQHKYATPVVAQKHEAEKVKAGLHGGHFFADGAKVTLELKCVERFSFDGAFGRTYVVTYADKHGRCVKYMGGSPLEKWEGFKKVQGTVKNAWYKTTAETRLQRIRVIEDKKSVVI